MRLISFDVGIKNLAYCIFTIEKDKWSIPEWNCVNLIATLNDAPLKFCCYSMKGKKKTDAERICGKNAKWLAPCSSSNGQNGEAVFCDLHAKKHDKYIIPKKQHSTSHLNKLKLAELEKEYNSIFSGGENNRPKMKKSEMIERMEKYYESKCFVAGCGEEKTKTKTAGDIDLVTIGRAIRRQLDNDSSVENTTHVIIENQISTIASRMKTIQGMIAQYFIMRFGDSVQIEFVSSHNKLKGFSSISSSQEKEKEKEKSEQTKKPTYKANKSDGIIICCRFFDSNPEMEFWSPVFERSKKRDDLADCFLQGIWYLKSSKKIYYADNLKINIVDVS